MTTVNLKETVGYETLIEALKKAAKELGWKASVKECYRREYKLGSLEEIQEHDKTKISLNGRLLPACEVILYYKGPRRLFYLNTGFWCTPYGFASKEKVKQYLEMVSEELFPAEESAK